MLTRVLKIQIQDVFGQVDQEKKVALAADGGSERSFQLPPAAVNYEVAFRLEAARLVMFFAVSNANVTMKTNSPTEPGQVIPLAADVPLVWYVNGSPANPFTKNVTGLFFTNHDAEKPADVEIRMLVDATPA